MHSCFDQGVIALSRTITACFDDDSIILY